LAEAVLLYSFLFGIVSVKSVDRYILLFALAYMPIYSAGVLAVDWEEYQCEDGSWNWGEASTDHSGYTGTGYFDSSGDIDEWFEITVNVPGDADYDISLRYALSQNTSDTNRDAQVKVGGVEAIASLDFPTTADWSTWTTVDFTLTLTAGDNTIRFTAIESGGLANFDRFDVDVDVDFMYWDTDFAPIALPALTYQGQSEADSATVTLYLSEDVEISADNDTDAELSSATDVLITEYKLGYDGDGASATGGTDTSYATYNNFLSTASDVTYVASDYTVDVTLYVRASNNSGEVADSGAYSATQTLTVTWLGP